MFPGLSYRGSKSSDLPPTSLPPQQPDPRAGRHDARAEEDAAASNCKWVMKGCAQQIENMSVTCLILLLLLCSFFPQPHLSSTWVSPPCDPLPAVAAGFRWKRWDLQTFRGTSDLSQKSLHQCLFVVLSEVKSAERKKSFQMHSQERHRVLQSVAFCRRAT